MAVYGTKEYYEENVVLAETKAELLCYALVHKIKESDTVPSVDQLRIACEVFIEACDEVDNAKERYNAYCSNESGSKTST